MPLRDEQTRLLLRLTLAPGIGPVLLRRAAQALGSFEAILSASEAALRRVKGIGAERARQLAAAFPGTAHLADDELALADKLGIHLVGCHEPEYPALLREIPDAPPLLYIRGSLDPANLDRFPVAIVGSRSCTHYGLEQGERFAAALAQAGLTIISGGARGIDTASHRAAIRLGGRTVAVLGCGLAECYPPDNRELFDRIADGHGAVLSELPLRTPPHADNFPARNRIISGLALGVLVVEAGRRSGSLITARLATEEHGRDVFALPSRIDSDAALGSLELIKAGGAALVTHPDDILQSLESPARHHHNGTHEARYTSPAANDSQADDRNPESDQDPHAQPTASTLFTSASPDRTNRLTESPRDAALTPAQRDILRALTEPKSLDDLSRDTGLGPAALRADITVLEIRRRVKRQGTRIARSN